MKKRGFTLAETLITLTIIGVVAAMTIPTLMNKYQEKTLESQFKKSYSILNQAVAISGRDYECYWQWNNSSGDYNTSECYDFWTNVLEQLKYTKVTDKLLSNQYKTIQQIIDEGGSARTACSNGIYRGEGTLKYYLADGSTLYMDSIAKNATTNLALDVNGDKGPNKWGYDVFALMVVKENTGGIKLLDEICGRIEVGGKRVKNILLGVDEVSTNMWKW